MINTDYKLIWADSYITLKLQYIFLCVCSGNHSLPYYFSSSDKNIRLLEILERTSELISKSHLSLGFTGWWKWKNSSALWGALMCRSPSFLPRALILGKAQDWAVTYLPSRHTGQFAYSRGKDIRSLIWDLIQAVSFSSALPTMEMVVSSSPHLLTFLN